MSITIEAQATRTLIQQDGVSRVAFNDDGSMEILTPTSNPTGNLVPTAGQVLGLGQTWQDVTGSRAGGTTYTNTTGRSIEVAVTITHTVTSGGACEVVIDGITTIYPYAYASGARSAVTFIVPAGRTYRCNFTNATLYLWSELR